MKVLVITGDKSFKGGNPRYDLQSSVVGQLDTFAHQGFFSGPAGFFQVLFAALRTRYDVISSQEPFFRGLLALIASRLSGARFNLQVHADILAQSWLKHVLAQVVLRHADSVRVVSEKIKEQVEKIGTDASISVLPIFVDLERFKRISRSPDARPTILWIGRFEAEKDPVSALRVLGEVREKGIDAKLIMLGAGKLEQKLRVAAVDLPVEFPGWQDPVAFLARAHVVLSTSRAESWGASIVEALAAGVPVVSPDVGIAREAGAIVVSRDRLTSALVETLASSQVRAELRLKMLLKDEWARAWRNTL